jgi:glycosyltransferase involved in cell wall biosynthesis
MVNRNAITYSLPSKSKISQKKVLLLFVNLLHSLLYVTILLNHRTKHMSDKAITVVPHKTVCLNMIVKDEVDVIRRCLATCKPLIDYWVIVDTGSTDGTQDAIREFMKDVPGELYERPWKNFEHNRNEALELARSRADYILIIDADDILTYEPGFKFGNLDKDCYYMPVAFDNLLYARIHLFNSKLGFKWVGVLHEYIVSPPSVTSGKFIDISYMCTTHGNRSKNPKKYEKDAEVLEAALVDDPHNSRHVFYLAQTYVAAKNYPKAIEAYQRRVDLGGWDEEVFYSLLQIARIYENTNQSPEKVVESFWKAFHFRPSRAEPLYYLSDYYFRLAKYEPSYSVSKLGMYIPLPPEDIMFVDWWAYKWGLPLVNSAAAWWINKYHESAELSTQLLSQQDLPPHIRTIVERNLKLAQESIAQSAS